MGWGTITTESCKKGNNIVLYEFLWIRRTRDYIQLSAYYCMQFSTRVRVRIRFSAWLVSSYAHIYILLSVCHCTIHVVIWLHSWIMYRERKWQFLVMKPPDVSHRDLLKTDEQQCRVKKRYVKIGRNNLWGLTCRQIDLLSVDSQIGQFPETFAHNATKNWDKTV